MTIVRDDTTFILVVALFIQDVYGGLLHMIVHLHRLLVIYDP